MKEKVFREKWEKWLRGGIRLYRVIHISAEQEKIGLSLRYDTSDLIQHRLLLFAPIVVIEGMPQMPIAGMQDLHAAILPLLQRTNTQLNATALQQGR